uniref:Uncharacterized protein n=1 Tax=Anguilla anguilla TaxID=7936 RepID=A0A0E9RVS0_ANGAN
MLVMVVLCFSFIMRDLYKIPSTCFALA